MADNPDNAGSRNVRDLLEALAPLGEVHGVQDYFLVNSQGRVLVRKPGTPWNDEIANACARDMAQAAEVVRLLPVGKGPERFFDFHFEAAQVMVWDFGMAYLVVVCGQDSNNPIARMTVNVVKEELRNDRRFKHFFAPPSGSSPSLLTEGDLGSELYDQAAILKQT